MLLRHGKDASKRYYVIYYGVKSLVHHGPPRHVSDALELVVHEDLWARERETEERGGRKGEREKGGREREGEGARGKEREGDMGVSARARGGVDRRRATYGVGTSLLEHVRTNIYCMGHC